MTVLRDALQQTLGSTYTLERELAGGGMSTVFVARDNTLGRSVVIKVLPYELAAGVSIDRFKREIMLSAALQHPHIVPVLTAGETDGLPFFIMPFVDGESLRERLSRGPLSVRETVSIMKDVARALAYAHGRGIIHRDIKPDNILLTAGSVTVTDFGVAKAIVASRQGKTPAPSGRTGPITLVGTSIGTPAYMAPEQAAGDPNTDHRADLYALGIVGYEMLVGTPPFHGRAPQQLLAAHLTEAPAPIGTRRYDVPAALATLIMQMLEKDPGKRPRSAADIARALEDPAVVSGTFVASPAREARRPMPVIWALAGAGILASVAAGGAWFTNRHLPPDSRPIEAAAPAVTTTPAGAHIKSIAVLPLVNISRDTGDAYFAAGMTAELTNALSRIAGLRVAGNVADASKEKQAADPTELGKALNVDMVMVGTVQRDQSRLRVTARLVNIADGLTIWSDVYQRDAKDVFKVQDEISSAIVAAVSPELAVAGKTKLASAGATAAPAGSAAAAPSPPASAVVAATVAPVAATPVPASTPGPAPDGMGRFGGRGPRPPMPPEMAAMFGSAQGTNNLKAYDLYLRGRYFVHKRGDDELKRALTSFKDATRLDSNFARAYAGIANAYALLPLYSSARPDSVMPLALAAINRAVALDSMLPDAYTSRATLLQSGWKWADAERDYRHALLLDPNSASTRQWYGEFLLVNGRTREAIPMLERAAALDPLAPVTLASYAVGLAIAHRADSAVALARHAVEMDSTLAVTRFLAGAVNLAADRAPDAVRYLEAAVHRDTTSMPATGLLGYAYAKTGNTKRATDIARALEAQAGRTNGAASAAARVYLGLGDNERALVLLQRAAADHDSFFSSESLAEQFFDPIRRDPRFAAIVASVGLDRRFLMPR